MANECVSDGNFDQLTTDLRYGRPVTQIVLDNTTNSTADGSISGSHAGTVMISQLNLTYTNGTPFTLLVTPVFHRPGRLVQTHDPGEVYIDERWAATFGAAPANPTLGATITTFGGAVSGLGTWRYASQRDAAATYCPLGQFTIPPTQQLKVSYDAKLRTAAGTGSSRYAYARSHRIVFLADITEDQTLP